VIKGGDMIKMKGAEVPELWDDLGIDKTSVHCNVVHQYENKEKKKVKLKK
jgi:hypothetical protein